MQHGDVTLNELAIMIREHSARNWHAPRELHGYERHVLEHLAKMLGKLATIVEQREHSLDPDDSVILREIVPDLLFWALDWTDEDLRNADLVQLIEARLTQNEQKIEARRRGSLEKG